MALRAVKKLLKPFKTATKYLSGETYATVSLAMPLLSKLLEENLQPIPDEDLMLAQVRACLLAGLSNRWEKVQRERPTFPTAHLP